MKKIKVDLFEAKLNLPQEYINKVRDEAKEQYGGFRGPTRQEMAQMGNLLNRIFSIQRGHEDKLTEVGKSVIQKFYGPVIKGVELDIKIVEPDDEEKLEMAQKMLQQEQEQESEIEQPEVELELKGIEHDIDKRKLINNIMQGEAQNVHSMMYDVREQVKKITGSDQLLDLYMEFLALNKKFDWDETQNLEMMMEQAPQMASAMETDWEEGEGEEGGDKPKIKARVLDLPMLVHETVKGIYELIASGAIDPDPVRAQKVLQAADTLSDEQEDIRYGPYIARDLRDYINSVADKISGANNIPNIREFVFGKMIQLQSETFVKLVTSILLKEKGPERIISKFINEIIEEHKSHQISQIPGFEEDTDEDLPVGVEEFPEEDEDNELLKMMRPQEKREEKPKQEDITKKLASMGKNQLNYELNKAIDSEDWEYAKEIQKMIERKGLSESINEDEKSAWQLSEEEWYEKVFSYLTVDFEMEEDEAETYMTIVATELEDLLNKATDPFKAASIIAANEEALEELDSTFENEFGDEESNAYEKLKLKHPDWNWDEAEEIDGEDLEDTSDFYDRNVNDNFEDDEEAYYDEEFEDEE